MSAGRFRTPTNAQRRAARRKSQRAANKSRPWFWLAAGGVAVLTVAILAGIRLASSGSGSEPGDLASNVAPGSGTDGELAQIRTADFHSMAVSPVDSNLILYGHHGGVLRSTDGGRTWTTTNLTGEMDDAMGMEFAGPDGNTVFAAGHDVFFRSDDAGLNWERIKPNLLGTDVHGLAVAPDNPNRLYANVVRFGLFRSDDGGKTWARAGATLPGDIMTLSAGPGGQLYASGMQGTILRSDDGGTTFKPTGRPAASLAMTVMASGTLDVVYAGAQGAILFSEDGGATWKERPVPGGGQVMLGAVNPANPLDVVVVSLQADGAGHVFRSRDAGATWGPG